ncbi:MAG: alpha/beta hydrolase [Myxococcota bacterium]
MLSWFLLACAPSDEMDLLETRTLVTEGEVPLWVRIVEPDPPANNTWVMVHGGPGLTHDHLLPLEALVDEGDRVVFYDQRGSGGSGEASAWRFGAHVRDLDDVIDASGANQVKLVGSSWGGLLSQIYAERRPERVEELVLIGSAPATYTALQAGALRFAERVQELQASGAIEGPIPSGIVDYLNAVLPAYFAEGRAIPDEARVPIHGETHGAISMANLFAGYDYTAEVATVSAPTRILVGDADPFGIDMSEAVRNDLASGDPLDIIAGCGHWPWFYCLDETLEAMTASR